MNGIGFSKGVGIIILEAPFSKLAVLVFPLPLINRPLIAQIYYLSILPLMCMVSIFKGEVLYTWGM